MSRRRRPSRSRAGPSDLFEAGDPLRQGALRDADLSGGVGERLSLGDRVEVAQLLQRQALEIECAEYHKNTNRLDQNHPLVCRTIDSVRVASKGLS